MRRRLNNFVSVVYSFLRMGIFKLIHGKNFYCGLIERISPNVVLEFNRGCKVKFGKKVRIHSGSKVKVRTGALLNIGDNVKINYNCIIVCHENISIGEGTEFGPSVYVYDHDHDFRAEGGLKAEKYKTSPIIIGNNVWIGANSIILQGSVIEDDCIIAAGSVVKGKVPRGSVFVQKREALIHRRVL